VSFEEPEQAGEPLAMNLLPLPVERLWKATRKHLNFYRIHIIFL